MRTRLFPLMLTLAAAGASVYSIVLPAAEVARAQGKTTAVVAEQPQKSAAPVPAPVAEEAAPSTTDEALRQKIESLAVGPPRNETQKLWAASFAAENIKEYEVAIAAVKKVVALTDSQQNPFVHLRLGWLHFLDQDYDQSIVEYKKSIEYAPLAVSPRQGLLNCYIATSRIDDAMEASLSILKLDPLNFRANKALGDMCYVKEDYGRSASYYQRLATAYPDDLQIAANLGWCYLKVGEKALALQIFDNVLAVQPENTSAANGYAVASAEKRDIAQTSQPGEASDKIVLRNPPSAARAVRYTLNGRYPVTLEPGKAQTLEPGRTWMIRYQPGKNARAVEQRLDPGEYLFGEEKDRITLEHQ